MAKAKENIAKIGESRDKISANKSVSLNETAIPKPLENLKIDALGSESPSSDSTSLTAREVSYRDEIASRLQLALKLPEHGEVQIKLTLDRSGKVVAIQAINSKSDKNKQYIEKTVASLMFPSFGKNFADSLDYMFLITLNSHY